MLKLVCRWLLVGISSLLATSFLASQDFSAAASQLAARIAERAQAASASITTRNRSSLNSEAVSLIQHELLRQLEARGWKIQKANGVETAVNVTFAENARTFVWTAEITKQKARDVAMVELARPIEENSLPSDRVLLTGTLLISSKAPLLDVTLLEGKIAEGAHLLALTLSAAQLYQLQSSQWRLVQSQPLGLTPVASRDLRGRIAADQSSAFDAYLPGIHCTGALTGRLSITCRESDDPWPLSDDRRVLAFYAANRNYFTGVISGTNPQNGNIDPFYSAAILDNRTVYASLDGRQRTGVDGHRPSAFAARWGSNITAIQSSCRTELVLASGTGDFGQGDNTTAFRPAAMEFSAASEPLPFNGPVLDLKTSADRQQALLIVSSSSGSYEVYLVTARCGA